MPVDTYSVMRADLWWRVAPLLLSFGLSSAAVMLFGRVLARRIRRLRVRPLGVSGTAEMEFVLAFPMFVATLMVTAQVALMINATLIVDYAAFCAARSAAVWLPQNLSAREPANTIEAHEDYTWMARSEKWRRIHRAAVMAAIPISPRASRFTFGIDFSKAEPLPITGDTLQSLASKADAQLRYGATIGQITLAVLDKWPYAYLGTNVDLLDASGHVAGKFDGTVTARVTHNFEMAVPYAGPLLGKAFGSRYLEYKGIGIGGYYVPISAAYTLALARP